MLTPIESFRLTVFRVVAARLSFTQAAELLHVSQPAVTSHIKTLEQELGVRLFERTAGAVRLTPAGERLFAYAAEVNRLAQETLHDIGSLNGEQRGRLRLGASTTIAQYLLPRLLGEFVQLHPRVDLSVISANTAQIVARLLAGESDLGLIEGPPGSASVKVDKFVDDEIAVIVAASHPFAALPPPGASLADLAEEPLLMREPGSGTRRVVENALRDAGIATRDLHVVMELDSTEAIKSGVEAGLGVGFVSRWALREPQTRAFHTIPVAGLTIKRSFQFVYPQGPDPDGPAAAFLVVARQFRGQFRTPDSR
jgi:DNA-binding transcriptional LysR family regulator